MLVALNVAVGMMSTGLGQAKLLVALASGRSMKGELLNI